MTTKAELEAELKQLKDEMKQRDAASDTATSTPKETAKKGADTADASLSDLSDVLKAKGLDPTEIEHLWAQVSSELDDFPNRKPLLTAVAAFGLGFMLGRMSKN